jgi:hypothetical protein
MDFNSGIFYVVIKKSALFVEVEVEEGVYEQQCVIDLTHQVMSNDETEVLLKLSQLYSEQGKQVLNSASGKGLAEIIMHNEAQELVHSEGWRKEKEI